MTIITTTLKQIRKHSPCEDGWADLLKHLGKTKADDEPLRFSTILESNGIDDALWSLRALSQKHHGKIRHLAADYAERVLYLFEKEYPEDKRPREAIQAARDHAEEKATAAGATGDTAWDERAARAATAAWDAVRAARAAEKKIQGELLIKYFG